MFKFFVYTIILVLNSFRISEQQCSVAIAGLDRKQPLILKRYGTHWEPWTPSSPFLSLSNRYACSGTSSNLISGLNEIQADMECQGNALKYQGRTVAPSALVCNTLITGNIKTTRTSCANGRGTISEIGFSIGAGQSWQYWVDLFQVCYSQVSADIIYSSHVLWGYSLLYKQSTSDTPQFKSIGTAPGVSVQKAYTTASQLTTFRNLFGTDLGNHYINYTQDKYLAKGHMAPNADFSLIPLQFATYFFVNAAPHWQAVNNNNWKRVENKIRRKGSEMRAQFKIYTGVHEILELPDSNNQLKEVYLLPNQRAIGVPKYLWKVVHYEIMEEGIAFVTLNNPYATAPPPLLCPNVCAAANWDAPEFKALDKGFTYCCDVNVLRRQIPIIPQLDIDDLLHG